MRFIASAIIKEIERRERATERTSLTGCRWQTSRPPLSALPMSSAWVNGSRVWDRQ
jgi:hypothetical protein